MEGIFSFSIRFKVRLKSCFNSWFVCKRLKRPCIEFTLTILLSFLLLAQSVRICQTFLNSLFVSSSLIAINAKCHFSSMCLAVSNSFKMLALCCFRKAGFLSVIFSTASAERITTFLSGWNNCWNNSSKLSWLSIDDAILLLRPIERKSPPFNMSAVLLILQKKGHLC